jgi:hypothetical protein
MEYTKTNINAFGGLDANKRPELLQNEQASDIENLRFDKLGYLINRNGVVAKPLKMTKTVAVDVQRVLWPIGTLGMTEYVLKAPWGVGSGTTSWAPYDDTTIGGLYSASPNTKRYSDKFMVYHVRIPAASITPQGASSIAEFDMYDLTQVDINGNAQAPSNHYTWRYKGAYVLIPLMGPSDFRDTFAIAPNGLPYVGTPATPDLDYPSMLVTVGARSILRADDKPSRTQIYAPQRWLGVHNVFEHENIAKDQNWIGHYVSMHQYRDTVVISDMTNQDLQLVDEYSEAEYNEERKHRFSLRENALAKFDVDDVVIDFGIGTNNFNDGVEAPMALYKFYLPRKSLEVTVDNFTSSFDNLLRSPTSLDVVAPFRDNWKPLPYNRIGAFLSTEYWYDVDVNELGVSLGLQSPSKYAGSGIAVNTKDKFIFTNADPNEQYDYLFGKLTLKNPDVNQDDTIASDVYRWKEMTIKYYPCSGISNAYGTFLTDEDRLWDKTSSNSAKVVKLKTKSGMEQNVPLGVWRYRFIWYLGNGEYSAPSAELVVPDILFSGLSESEMNESGIPYARPAGLNTLDDAYKTNIDVDGVTFLNELNGTEHFQIFKVNPNNANELILTNYGKNFIKIKEKLFYPDHIYAAKESSTSGASWPNIDQGQWTSQSLLAKGNVSAICTLFANSIDLTLNGTICETAFSTYQHTDADTINEVEVTSYKSGAVSLTVPLFPASYQDFNTEKTYSFNSVFTKRGVIRTAYQNRQRWSSHPMFRTDVPAYQIVLGGRCLYGVTKVQSDPANDIAEKGERVYFNVVPFQTYHFQNTDQHYERNNWDDDGLYPESGPSAKARYNYRNMTQVRGVDEESKRILYTMPDVPNEVQSRIVLSGFGDINLCGFDDYGTVYPERKNNTLGDSTLHKSVVRHFWHVQKDYYGVIYTDPVTQRQYDTELTSPYYWEGFNANPVHSYISFQTNANLPQDDSYVNGVYTPSMHTIRFNNLKVNVVLPGERLAIPEQLSMYVPSSLLFDAPHIKIIIPANRIPRRARQLMIFRTRASHDNAWQPHDYGFVKAVDIIRDKDTGFPSGSHLEKIEFLDDVKSEDMDFSYNLNDYEGFTEPISSRFCLPLNERVFYANIKERYRPKAPRNSVKILANPADASQLDHKNLNVGTNSELQKLWSNRLIYGTSATINIDKRYLYYFIAYNDAARSYSLAAFSGMIDRGDLQGSTGNPPVSNANSKVIHYCLPSAYDESVEHLNIYRFQTNTQLSIVPFVGRQSQFAYPSAVGQVGYFYVAQGLVEYNGTVYYPNSVIKIEHGGDTGVPRPPFNPVGMPNYMNHFVNYFSQTTAPYQPLGITNRGAMATYCAPVIYDITSFFDTTTNLSGYLEKIGDIVPENEGIFYDDDLPSLGRVPLLQFFQNEDIMPAGLRWSEPYQPNKIKLGSLMEVRSGDGDQITAMAQLYGNLVILKERSMHRLAVQGANVPISRVDEISNNVGCIAPNTAITVDNTLYFLSWAGFYKYDNNVLSKIDGAFAEELQVRLRSNINGVMNPAIRDASCGWNPTYREIYLNIPVMSTTNSEDAYEVTGVTGAQGVTLMDNAGERTVRGMVYAINIDTGFVTKHRYMDDALYFTDPSGIIPTVKFPELALLLGNAPTQRAPRVASRLYYTNTLGQMRSAECLPPRTYNYNIGFRPYPAQASISYLQTSFYIESPTKELNISFDKYKDDLFLYNQNQAGVWFNDIQYRNVRVFWQSKSFTGDDKTILKRVRKVFSYISANIQPAVVRGIVHTSPGGGKNVSDITWEYQYFISDPLNPGYGQSATGELSAIPTEAAGSSSSASQNRGERHLFQVEGGGSFQMEYFGFYWKPVNTYQR